MTPKEEAERLREVDRVLENAQRVKRQIRRTIRETERRAGERRERFRRAGILP